MLEAGCSKWSQQRLRLRWNVLDQRHDVGIVNTDTLCNLPAPLRPGLPERQTHDYKRHGTTTLFAALNILNGKVIGSCLPRHRGKEFIRFLNQLEKEVPPELDIHLILDNYSTHKSAAVQRWLKLKKRRRFHFHFTPTSSSWLNQVERWFGPITEKMIRRGTFHSVDELERAIYAWLASWNDTPKALSGRLPLTSSSTRFVVVKN
jgi:transposase